MNNTVGAVWIENFLKTGPEKIFQVFLVICLVMYSLFCVVVIRQVGVMTESFESDSNAKIKLVAWIQFFVSVGLTILAVLWL